MSKLNDVFNEFARAFVGSIEDDREIAFPDQLSRDQLDGSLDSLHHVDRYLDYVHAHRDELTDSEWHTTVLRAGAYVGEVVRHEAPDGIVNWIDYNDYMPTQPKLHALIPERTVATCAFTVMTSGFMSMPLNKIARYIDEGSEHSVHFFATADLAQARKESPA
jgi:hypothetical protein